MGNASCTPILLPPTVGIGDPDQLSHYMAIANVMFYLNNYPETCTTSAATTNNQKHSSGQRTAVQKSCHISVQVFPKINMYRSTAQEATVLLCTFK